MAPKKTAKKPKVKKLVKATKVSEIKPLIKFDF